MTYAELKAALEALTPEQLALEAQWCGDDRGGIIESLTFTPEDCLRDDGDSGELFLRSQLEEACEGDPSRLEAAVVTCPKGTPLLFTDGVT